MTISVEPDTIDSLITEYQRFCLYIGIELGSADEHLWDPRLNQYQRGYLRVFCGRWEVAEARSRGTVA